MAINNDLHDPKNKGLRGAWNRTLGQKDLHGNSYLSLFTSEAILTALTFTPKVKDKTRENDLEHGAEKEKPFSERPYIDTVTNKELTPLALALVSAIIATPVALVSGVGADLVDPKTEFDYTLSVPLETSSEQALSFSYQGNDYVLIEDGERFELYLNEESNILSLLPQQDAVFLSKALRGQFEATAEGEFVNGFSFSHRYEGISEPVLDDDGDVIRLYADVNQAYSSINLVEDQQSLQTLWADVQTTSLTSNYGLSSTEIANLDIDYTYGDGAKDGFTYGMLGGYLFLIFVFAHSTARERVGKNPVNRRRKEARKKL